MQYKEGEKKPQHEHDANHDDKKKELGGNRTKMMEETDDEVCGTFHKNEQQTYIPYTVYLLRNFGGWNTVVSVLTNIPNLNRFKLSYKLCALTRSSAAFGSWLRLPKRNWGGEHESAINIYDV